MTIIIFLTGILIGFIMAGILFTIKAEAQDKQWHLYLDVLNKGLKKLARKVDKVSDKALDPILDKTLDKTLEDEVSEDVSEDYPDNISRDY